MMIDDDDDDGDDDDDDNDDDDDDDDDDDNDNGDPVSIVEWFTDPAVQCFRTNTAGEHYMVQLCMENILQQIKYSRVCRILIL